ncbi:MAG: hypothetical protein JXA67_21840 [Micromonosporaceae bacterium]|nr:hypothetical protein [Micromonosporaceae bacterium]
MDQIRKICSRKRAEDILYALEQGPLHYCEIQQDVTISTHQILHGHTLTDTLNWLRDEHLVVRKVDAGEITYELTPCGVDHLGLIKQIRRLEATGQTDDQETPR